MTCHRWTLKPHWLALAACAALAPAARAVDFNWASGDFVPGVTAPAPLTAADTLFILAGGTKRFVGTSFTNQGLVRWQADPVQGGNSASVLNAGTWQAESDANALTWNFGGQPTFTNTGTYRKTAGVLSNVGSWAFVNNGGLIDVQTGAIDFNGGSNSFNAGTRFSGAGQAMVTGGSTVNGSFQSDNLVFAGGSNNGVAAMLTGGVANPAGQVGWTGGDFSGGWTIASGSTMAATGAATKRQVGAQIVNNGSYLWNTTSNLQGGNSSSFTNNGLTEVSQSTSFTWNFGGQHAFTTHAGATVRATNNAQLTFGNLALTSNGSLLVADAGSAIEYSGDNNRFNSGTTFSGEHRASGTSTYVGAIQADDLRWVSGNQLGGDGSAGSKATLAGSVRWQGGDLSRSFTIDAGATLAGEGAATKRQVGTQIVNDGNFLWNTTSNLQGGNSSSFTNNGLTEVSQSTSFTWNFGGQHAFTTHAGATVRATNNAQLTFGNLALTSNGSLLVADAGSAIVYIGDNNRFNNGTTFSGEHRASGTSTYVGAIQTDGLRWVAGSQLGGDGSAGSKATLTGSVRWEGGDVSRNFTIDTGATVVGEGAATKRQVGAQIVNNGSFLWNTTSNLQGGNSSSFTNNGLTEVSQSTSFTWNYGGQHAFTTEAGATVRASNNAQLTFGNLALTSNGSLLVADAGSAIVYIGDNNRFNNGTTFSGEHRASGTSTYVGAIQADGLRWVAGSQLGGDGSAGSKATLAGSVRWEGGDVSRNFTIDAGATLVGEGAATKRQVNAQIVNNGSILWNTETAWQGGNSSRLTNNSRVEIASDADMTWNFGGQAAMDNNGLFIKTAGAGLTSLAALALANNGTMDARAGTIGLPTGFANAGRLMGTAAFSLSGTLTNHGHLAPGAAPAMLTINGNLLQSALGALDIDLEGLAQHDLLQVNGSVTLNGTLALSCFGNCLFAVGDEVVVLDATGQLSGQFANTTMSGFGSGQFDVVYDTVQDRVLLRVTEAVTPPPVPEPGIPAMLLAGLAGLGWLAKRRRGQAASLLPVRHQEVEQGAHAGRLQAR